MKNLSGICIKLKGLSPVLVSINYVGHVNILSN